MRIAGEKNSHVVNGLSRWRVSPSMACSELPEQATLARTSVILSTSGFPRSGDDPDSLKT